MAGVAENMFLYWASGSTPCWRVQIVLEEKGLQGYKSKRIDFNKQEHKCAGILATNPRGQVPTFRDGDLKVNDSLAVCDYLERTYSDKGTPLIPKEGDGEAICCVLQRMHEAHSNFQHFLIENILYYRFDNESGLTKELDEKLLKSRYVNARTELKRWDNYLKEVITSVTGAICEWNFSATTLSDENHANGQEYIAGKDFTMADVYLFPHIAFCVRFGLDLSKYSHLSRYYEKLRLRPSIQQTWPPDWLETKKDEESQYFIPLNLE